MACDALFNTPCFIFGFVPLVLLLYWVVPSRRWKHVMIAASGLVFYSFWDIRFSVLLVAAAVADYLIAIRLAASPRPRRWLIASLVFNLGVLAVFKYAMFAAENARSLLALLGSDVELPYFSIVLPIGISFYTFKTLSYTIDVYRREIPPTRDFIKYLAFILLFADMVAGPIIRYRSLSDQLDALPRRLPLVLALGGLELFAVGLFKKAVIADTVARFSDPLWASPEILTTPAAWIAALGFAVQLYFDFSGYSDMAIGLGMMMGIVIPINFDAPYKALDPSDFWRRWHISLSTFLRDYLYIPLGGNRGKAWRVSVNLLVVMVLGGLWHGAAWTFILWGTYHGLLLVAYKTWRARWDEVATPIRQVAMFLLVVVGWVVFRAPDVGTALDVYAAMFVPTGMAAVSTALPALAFIVAVVFFTFVAKPTSRWQFAPTAARAAGAGIVFVLAILAVRMGDSPFLYYQF